MFDVEAYISHYTGATRLERLSVIAHHPSSDAGLSAHAFALIEQQCKQDGNLVKYKEMFARTLSDISQENSSARQATGTFLLLRFFKRQQ